MLDRDPMGADRRGESLRADERTSAPQLNGAESLASERPSSPALHDDDQSTAAAAASESTTAPAAVPARTPRVQLSVFDLALAQHDCPAARDVYALLGRSVDELRRLSAALDHAGALRSFAVDVDELLYRLEALGARAIEEVSRAQ